jgi:xanthine/CO dehydrogenase XdhC/CoxF family maturation factor
VGLDLGADGPEQVAISIVAELLSAWSRREPRHLREKELAVHAAR